ncbi:MAG: nitroreductase family protein [Bacteroidia bacterium]|nr:nitroreductase family protein [Bacteroidia bacterium]
MTFEEIVRYRRSVRHYDAEKEIDTEKVRHCIELATLAPVSSNMQLWEFYHITSPETLQKLTKACLGQSAARTAKQMVVFVTRQGLYRERAKKVLDFEIGNIERNSPPERQANRIKNRKLYYGKLMLFFYARFFGLLGLFRKFLSFCIGFFSPITRQVSEADVRVVVHKTCGLAAQTFMLAMAGEGYDTCPMEGFDSRIARKALRLPRGAEINMIISCGIRLPQGIWGEQYRVPFSDVYREI